MATQIAPTQLPVIRAAGGILLRDSPSGNEVMIVFRTKHRDWTLPKGKLKEDESFQEAALREVEEETGCHCVLSDYLGMISYAHEGIPKVVMFWKMVVLEERPRAGDEEISEALWLPVPAALQVLTYAQERSLLARVSPPLPTHGVSTPEPEVYVEITSAQASPGVLEVESPVAEPEPALLELTLAPDARAVPVSPEQAAAPLPEPSVVAAHEPEPLAVREPEPEVPVEIESAVAPEVEALTAVPEPSYPEPEFVLAPDAAVAAALPERGAASVLERPMVSIDDPETPPAFAAEPGLHPEPRSIADISQDQLAASREYQTTRSREAQIVQTSHNPISDISLTATPEEESPFTSIIGSVKRLLPRPRFRIAALMWPPHGGRVLEHELESFRVEVNYLASRDTETDNPWSSPVQQHYANAARCLVEKDVEGGWKALRAARRYAALALRPAELSARAQVLRDEAVKISGWRGGAIQRLLDLNDDWLNHARLMDAMLLRDDDAAELQQRAHKTRLRLQLLFFICIAGVISLLLSFSSPGAFQDYTPLAFAGLLGSALSAAQQIVQARERGKLPGIPILLALLLSAAAAGLIADPIYRFGSHYLKLKHTNDLALYALAFIVGYSVERTLSHFAGYSRDNVSVHY